MLTTRKYGNAFFSAILKSDVHAVKCQPERSGGKTSWPLGFKPHKDDCVVAHKCRWCPTHTGYCVCKWLFTYIQNIARFIDVNSVHNVCLCQATCWARWPFHESWDFVKRVRELNAV